MSDDAIHVPTDRAQAEEDLAFLKSIVGEQNPFARKFGLIYMAGGLCYGAQCLFGWLFLQLGDGLPTALHLINAILPSIVFFAVLGFAVVRDRNKNDGQSVVARGIDAAFQGTGLANIVLVAVFGVAALRAGDLALWLFYPVTVCVLQGTVWFGAARLRRRWWMGAVSAGWLVAGLLAGLLVNNIGAYIAVVGIALFALMALPGWVVMRLNQRG